MATYLFAAQSAMGHLNPMFAIARRLESRGHRVVFACPAREPVEKAILAKGFPLAKLPTPLSTMGLALLHLTSGFLETAFALRMFSAGLVPYARALAPILAEHADGRVQLVVSAGGAYEVLRARGVPEHVMLFERVPQVEVLDSVDAVISHGGNNTVNETLAAGRPLLVLPVGGEQGDNASRVEHLGAGLRADLNGSPAAEIASKVARLLDEPSFARRARECAEALARTAGPETAAALIERVVATRRPLVRPAGYPLTVLRDAPLPG